MHVCTTIKCFWWTKFDVKCWMSPADLFGIFKHSVINVLHSVAREHIGCRWAKATLPTVTHCNVKLVSFKDSSSRSLILCFKILTQSIKCLFSISGFLWIYYIWKQRGYFTENSLILVNLTYDDQLILKKCVDGPYSIMSILISWWCFTVKCDLRLGLDSYALNYSSCGWVGNNISPSWQDLSLGGTSHCTVTRLEPYAYEWGDFHNSDRQVALT